MSINRRQFLLSTAGAAVGAIIPSFYYRALEHFERFEVPMLAAPSRVTQDLLVVNINEYLELSLGDPYADLPTLSYREFFEQYEPEGFDELSRWGLLRSELDQPMLDSEYQMDMWLLRDGPTAQAYRLLKSLDLGPSLDGPNAVGGLDFRTEANMVGSWLAVCPEDEVSLSLLQQRLTDLGTGIRVVWT